ncbi:hypothetical protein DXX93_14670 [Thalassotalea euphylliae]|uniref:OmpA-like domain-containing protein n=1 Tax=Thalassotalea euphylliae TaxID=1655234 RepID=A0A3E0TUS7_9GAMM|nr:type IVB secretion system protein IcmH/DotU [Thalassotalea euphylliae]REL27675.1 hypothetical protein DXX93_14670 [Thalassotalea euphylliae]
MADDGNKTIIMPNPGGRRRPAPGNGFGQSQPDNIHPAPGEQSPLGHQPSHLTPSSQQHPAAHHVHDLTFGSLPNTYLANANDILVFVGNLNCVEPMADVTSIRREVESLFTGFESNLTALGYPADKIVLARYMLCCLVDELVLNTPWGSQSSWSQQTLLSKYHNETWGGEKFFLILDKLQANLSQNIALIELAYVCLATGFCGKYRLAKDEGAGLFAVQQKLARILEQYYPQADTELSPQWRGIGRGNEASKISTSPWLWASILLLILSATYLFLFFDLRKQTEPVYQMLAKVGWQDIIDQELMNYNQPTSADTGKTPINLSALLRADINAQKVMLGEQDGFAVIHLVHPALFASGSTVPAAESLPSTSAIAQLLTEFQGRLLIVGHTDSTGKAESNWVISLKRANAVKDWLAGVNPQPGRYIARGVADTQPLKPNDSAENRQLNRRVDIVLLAKGAN